MILSKSPKDQGICERNPMRCVQNPGKSRKKFRMKRKYHWPAKKAKANVNMDCFSLIKINFLMSGNQGSV